MKQNPQAVVGAAPHLGAPSSPVIKATVPDADAEGMLTFAEGCDFLRMRPRWVGMRVKDGTLPHIRCGRKIRFLRSALIAWCKQQEKGGLAK